MTVMPSGAVPSTDGVCHDACQSSHVAGTICLADVSDPPFPYRKVILMRPIVLALTAAIGLATVAAHAAPPNPSGKQQLTAREMAAESILADIDQATSIDEGTGSGVIYIFFDPNCPYCHQLYLNTRDWITQDKAQLRWIPVGILTTTSEGKAIAMLGADDPLQAFYKNEDNYNRGGGIDEDLPTPEISAQLAANENLLRRTRSGAVPAMVFRTKDGAPVLITGSPPKDKLPVVLRYLSGDGPG